MFLRIRRSGRVGFLTLLVIALVGVFVGLRLVSLAAPRPGPSVADHPDMPGATPAAPPTFTIGPVDGLTAGWHWAPAVTSIPLGTVALFHQAAATDAAVIWTGASEVARNDQGSTAQCALMAVGSSVVEVQVIPAAGPAFSSQSVLTVVDLPPEQITVTPLQVWVDPLEIDDGLPQDQLNQVTMGYFFGPPIAALRDLGKGQYRTSIGRIIKMNVQVVPAGFAPLAEWRFDGQPLPPQSGYAQSAFFDGVGQAEAKQFPGIGNHVVEVGPLLSPAVLQLETYSVTITSHVSQQNVVPEGEPITFEAVTDPPGYEPDITWLSSTKYGSAYPILGEGPVFVAEFNDTFGPLPEDPGIPFQWLGVKADNVVFNQDRKCPFADRGDAPDDTMAPGLPNACLSGIFCIDVGEFPSLCGTVNCRTAPVGWREPFHTDFTDVWLGPQPNTETAEADAYQPCCDWVTLGFPPPPPPSDPCDNGPGAPHILCLDGPCTTGVIGDGGCPEKFNIPFGLTPTGPCYWLFQVSVGAAAPDVPRFANVVVDWDNSGQYGDAPAEWSCIDCPVAYTPGGSQILVALFPCPPGKIIDPCAEAFLGWCIVPFWTRFEVSRTALAPFFPPPLQWEGCGPPLPGFVFGETQDLVVYTDPQQNPKFQDCNGNQRPDAVDIATGTSQDQNHDGIPDECLPGCCFPNGQCIHLPQPSCQAQGGIPVPACGGDNDNNGMDNACQQQP